jgi:hypothetical protein
MARAHFKTGIAGADTDIAQIFRACYNISMLQATAGIKTVNAQWFTAHIIVKTLPGVYYTKSKNFRFFALCSFFEDRTPCFGDRIIHSEDRPPHSEDRTLL